MCSGIGQPKRSGRHPPRYRLFTGDHRRSFLRLCFDRATAECDQTLSGELHHLRRNQCLRVTAAMKACLYGWMLFLAASGCKPGAERTREFNGDTALAYVHTQLAFGPRIPNTEGHRKTGDWIIAQLKARADSVEVQAFTHVAVNGQTLKLRNIIGRFRPRETDRILYLAHWDSRPKADRSANVGDQMRSVR